MLHRDCSVISTYGFALYQGTTLQAAEKLVVDQF
jgi:hypothetical protein